MGVYMAQPLNIPIAGYWHYRQSARRLRDVAIGMPLRLVRDPTNEHDTLAVQVWLDTAGMLGYVPKANNVDIAWALDGGVAVKALFAGFLRTEPMMQIVWP
jgi:hypothetical protein